MTTLIVYGLMTGLKVLKKVMIGMLVITFGYELSLVVRDGTIQNLFYLKDPLVTNDFLMGLTGNQIPHTIGHESIEHGRHGPMPLWIIESLRNTSGFS